MGARYLRFNAVGLAGFLVQLAVVGLLTNASLATPVLATVVAIEAAVLHNFFWHERWTWADRRIEGAGLRADPAVLKRLLRFHLANGLISIAGNVAIVALLTGLNPIAANAIAVLICSLLNFTAGDKLVFATRPPVAQSSPTCP